jgi:hypothetical protein
MMVVEVKKRTSSIDFRKYGLKEDGQSKFLWVQAGVA